MRVPESATTSGATPPADNLAIPRIEAERLWKVGTLTYTSRSLVRLFFVLLWGDFALAVRDRALQGVVQLLFKRFGASDMFSGLLLASIPSALGMVIGPVVAYKSDRLRTRWGRRIPFLIVTTPFVSLGLLGLAFSPQLGGQLQSLLGPYSPGAASSVLLVLAIFWVVFEISLAASGGVWGALVNDVVPQEVLGRFFGLFRAVSLIIGIVFFFRMMGDVESHFSIILLLVALIYAVGFAVMCLKVKEGNYPPPPDDSNGHESPFTAVKNYFKDGFEQPFFLWYFASSILGNIASAPFNIYSIFYARSVSLGLPAYGECIALTYCFSLVLTYPLGWLADRFHPVRVTFVFVALYGVVMACCYLLVRDGRTFAVALVVHGVVAGCFNTTSASLGARLLPRAKFAEIGSVGGILFSLINMMFVPAMGLLLDHENHDYRFTFLVGSVISVLAIVAFAVLHGKFIALGGPEHFRPPEAEAVAV
jgi:MFS family permease